MHHDPEITALGATVVGDGRCAFRVWAPKAERVSVRLVGPSDRSIPLKSGERGYHHAVVDGVRPGDRYCYRLDGGTERPDPASRSQPEGVHGPSEVVAGGGGGREGEDGFDWTDDRWLNPPLSRHVIYELHVGTFTDQGTFEAIIPHLGYLRDLGVTAVELMPICQFPGSRNWGYDGVGLYAAQHSYGGPAGLRRLVNACHRAGLAVFLDLVYNHLGPEGNYLADFGAYFTDRYCTPWGRALNFDGADSDQVRDFFIQNALYWVTDCHIDGLRLDAVHAIIDPSPLPFIEELTDAVHRRADELKRRVLVAAESGANDARLVRRREMGGHGLDAQWNDDFHHAVRMLLPDIKGLTYAGFGQMSHLVKALTDGYVYTGEYQPFHRRRHGSPSRALPAERFVVFSQNHDQVGNQMGGERLSHLVSFEAAKLAAGMVLLSPYVPLLFMGEEYAETAPFLYFVSHSDPALVEAVRRGRREEFKSFGWSGEPPDPQDEGTFLRSKLDHTLRERGRHRAMLELYRTLLGLRRSVPALVNLSKDHLQAAPLVEERIITLRRWWGRSEFFAVFNFNGLSGPVPLRLPAGAWDRLVDSSDTRWEGGGALSPERLVSDGAATLELGPTAFAAYARRSD